MREIFGLLCTHSSLLRSLPKSPVAPPRGDEPDEGPAAAAAAVEIADKAAMSWYHKWTQQSHVISTSTLSVQQYCPGCTINCLRLRNGFCVSQPSQHDCTCRPSAHHCNANTADITPVARAAPPELSWPPRGLRGLMRRSPMTALPRLDKNPLLPLALLALPLRLSCKQHMPPEQQVKCQVRQRVQLQQWQLHQIPGQ